MLAVALILVLVALMASYHALLGWLVVKVLPARGPYRVVDANPGRP